MAPQIGSFGNVLILLVMTLVRGTQRTGKAFVINLALADLCVAAIADPMCVTGKGARAVSGVDVPVF